MNGALPPTVIMTMMRATAPAQPLTLLDMEYRRARKRLDARLQYLHPAGFLMPYPWVVRWVIPSLQMGLVTHRHQHETFSAALAHCEAIRRLGVDACVRPN